MKEAEKVSAKLQRKYKKRHDMVAGNNVEINVSIGQTSTLESQRVKSVEEKEIDSMSNRLLMN